MVGSPHAGALTRGPPLHATIPRGEPLENFGSPGMMGTEDGLAPPRRDATNRNPPSHAIPPREGTQAKFGPRPGQNFLPR